MVSTVDFLRALLERAIEDDLVWPSETVRSVPDDSDLGYLHHIDAAELAGLMAILDRFVADRNNASIQTAVADGHWTAWRVGRPETAFGAGSEREAILRLLGAGDEACGACGGSGRYVGLQAVEPCPECIGSGKRAPV